MYSERYLKILESVLIMHGIKIEYDINNTEERNKALVNGLREYINNTEEREKDIMNDKNRQLAIKILYLFEDLLEKYNITIPSEDRDENSSRLDGEEYFTLQSAIINLLDGEEQK